jgi:hypothetical protein
VESPFRETTRPDFTTKLITDVARIGRSPHKQFNRVSWRFKMSKGQVDNKRDQKKPAKSVKEKKQAKKDKRDKKANSGILTGSI